MLSIATVQGVNESLDDSATREALKKETPEQAAARLRAESKDLRQSVRFGAFSVAETGRCSSYSYCGWPDVSACCPLQIPPRDGIAWTEPPQALLYGNRYACTTTFPQLTLMLREAPCAQDKA